MTKYIGLDPYGRRAAWIERYRGKPLTVREQQVLQYTANDMSDRTIATAIKRTVNCVERHQEVIKIKLLRGSRAGCVAQGFRLGYLV